MSLKHGFISAVADGSDASKLRPSNWGSTSTNYTTDPTHVFTGGNLGALLYRDTANVEGVNWLESVAAGQILASGGVGVAPAWTASPSLTAILLGDGSAASPAMRNSTYTTTGPFWEAGPIYSISVGGTKRVSVSTTALTSTLPLLFATDNAVDIGASGARPRDGYFGSGVVVPRVYAGSTSAAMVMRSVADGVGLLSNVAESGFTRLILGTNTSSGVSIKKNGTAFNFRLGDDSGDANITAGIIQTSGQIVSPGGANIALNPNTGLVTIAGSTRLSGSASVYGSSVATGTVITNDAQTVANNAVVSLGPDTTSGLIDIQVDEDLVTATYMLRGTANTTVEILDSTNIFTNAAGGANSLNIYWSAANSRYEIENKRGASRTIRIIRRGK